MTKFNKMRLFALFSSLPLIFFLVLAVLLGERIFMGDPKVLPSALIGKQVPEFNLPSLEGMKSPPLGAADLRNGRISIVNVWASWCIPCRAEHAVLNDISAKTLLEKRMGQPQLVGINYKDQPAAARDFLQKLGNPYARIGVDADGRAGIDFGVYGVPETFVVDGTGRIVYKHVGPLTGETLKKEILPALEKAARP